MTEAPETTAIKRSAQEGMKETSRQLRGNILSELADDKADISDESYELLKFHGTYFGYDRDSATERKKQGLDKEYEFMVRLRIPAGGMTAEQYLAMDTLADKYANGTIRITTRETFQFHVIKKHHLKPHIAEINQALVSTLSACGDVVRNIMASNAPYDNAKYNRLRTDANKLAVFCAPKTAAYDELWSDKKGPEHVEEPLYGLHYLPRKFKIAVIIPEDNTPDALSHDLAFVQIWEGEALKGYNVLVGGGLGMNHEPGKENKKTYPRLADAIAFVGAEDLLNATEAVVKLQRDYGDRGDRKHARLKYLVQEKGTAWIRTEFDKYYAATNPKSAPQAPIPVTYQVPDYMGWHPQGNGKWFLGIRVPSGRVVDYTEVHKSGYTAEADPKINGVKYRSGLRAIIEKFQPHITLTADQNIVLSNISENDKAAIEAVLAEYKIPHRSAFTHFERHFMSCVALPTCGKALAEAERVQFPVVQSIQAALDKHGLRDERISARMTGCPNGCARPYIGDFSIVGRMPGHYVLFIGGNFEGTRLQTKVLDKVPEEHLATALEPMFALFTQHRQQGEGFGDFCHRYGVEAVTNHAVEVLKDKAFKWAVAV